jgi:Uma2 family endonuclease
METVLELEKIETPAIGRKKFRADEVYKMIEAGILPEESGWEFIDGEILQKMSIGSKHASVVRRLSKLLERRFGEIVLVSGQNPIHIDEYNEPEPDIALLKPREDFYAEDHPQPRDVLLLIEVADSSVEFDRETKKSLYAAAEIGEFWLVNLKENTVEVYTQPKNGGYRLTRILESGEVLQSSAIENLSLEVGEILG